MSFSVNEKRRKEAYNFLTDLHDQVIKSKEESIKQFDKVIDEIILLIESIENESGFPGDL